MIYCLIKRKKKEKNKRKKKLSQFTMHSLGGVVVTPHIFVLDVAIHGERSSNI